MPPDTVLRAQTILAVIPARAGSKGLPRKNVLPFAGKPLIAWTIEQARESELVDRVIVSTDGDEIADVAQAYGAEVPFRRPAALASDTASSIDVILHAIDQVGQSGSQFSIVALLEPTSPLRDIADIDGAIRKLLSTPDAESIVGVAEVEGMHPAFVLREKNGYLEPYLGVPATGLRRQVIEPLLFLEGSIYVAYVESLRKRRTFYHERTIGWPVAKYKSVEIDDMCDLIVAEALLAARRDGRLT